MIGKLFHQFCDAVVMLHSEHNVGRRSRNHCRALAAVTCCDDHTSAAVWDLLSNDARFVCVPNF